MSGAERVFHGDSVAQAVAEDVPGIGEEARTVRVERSDDEFRSLGRNTPCASFAEALEQSRSPGSGLSFAYFRLISFFDTITS